MHDLFCIEVKDEHEVRYGHKKTHTARLIEASINTFRVAGVV